MLLWLVGLSRRGVSLSKGLPSRPSAPSPFPDAREVMINSGLALSPPSAPPGAHTLRGHGFPTVPSDAGRVHPLASAPGARTRFGVLVPFPPAVYGTPPRSPPARRPAPRTKPPVAGRAAAWRSGEPRCPRARFPVRAAARHRPIGRVSTRLSPPRPRPPASSAPPDRGGAAFSAQSPVDSRATDSRATAWEGLRRRESPPSPALPPRFKART